MRGRSPPKVISAHHNVFGGLSREVSTFFLFYSLKAKKIYRVLLSTIKSNSDHLCPRCLVRKIDAIKMGTRFDMRNRRTNIRVDDHPRQNTIERARQLIFEQGIPLDSKRLKEVLGKFCGVPIRVRTYK
jgi:hypothetical protein